MSSILALEEVSLSDLGLDLPGPREPAPHTEDLESHGRVLRRTTPPTITGEKIGKIASLYYFVSSDALIVDLGDDFTDKPELHAVGVVSAGGEVLGIIRRESLFSLLGRSFGREVLRKRDVSRLIEKTTVFPCEENIFTVSDQISREIKEEDRQYYLLIGKGDNFKGIFSGRDMLVYLSEITRQDMLLARKIQTRIVKENDVVHGMNFSSASASLMAKGVGGDFYMMKEIRNGTWFGCLCDVSGKGMAASLLTSVLSGFINTYDYRKGLKTFALDLNAHLYSSFQGEKFVTGVFFILNERSGVVEFIDLGHALCYIFKEVDFCQDEAHQTCRPLGVSSEVDAEPFSLVLQPGEKLLIMTDGLIEQNDPGGQLFSLERIGSLFRDNREDNAESLKVKLLEDFHSFKSNVSQHDDCTFMILDYSGNSVPVSQGTELLNDKVEQSIRNGKPVRVTTYRYSTRMRNYIDSLLDRFLMEAGLESLRNKISYCVHELATNAKKANTKRVYFDEKGLDLHVPAEYEKGMTSFKVDTLKDIDRYLAMQEEEKLSIRISFLLTASSLKIVVGNNVEMTAEEKARVRHKLKVAASTGAAVEDFYDKVEDYSEGAGLGIVMMTRMLESMGLGAKALKIRSGGGKTTATLHLGR